MKKCKSIRCEDLYRPVKDPKINRLRNILSALVNLETQIGDTDDIDENCFLLIVIHAIDNVKIEIEKLRQKSRRGVRK